MPGKKVSGDYPTPVAFASRVVAYLEEAHAIKPDTVLEPSCGEGNFLVAALRLNAARYIGVELNPVYCKRARQRFRGDERVEIFQKDFFSYPLAELSSASLLIIGNPPWVLSSTLGALDAVNPVLRDNPRSLKGLDAITGEGDFDLAEAFCLRLIRNFKHSVTTLALILKSSVARRVVEYLHAQRIGAAAEVLRFDAYAVFHVHTAAAVLCLRLDPALPPPESCSVYAFDSAKPVFLEKLVFSAAGNLHKAGTDIFGGVSELVWRQGVKHDCSKVMVFKKQGESLINGLGEKADIEPCCIYPLLKGSETREAIRTDFVNYVLLTQSFVGESTDRLATTVPRSYAYLKAHEAFFLKRKSSVYKSAPPFAIFGIGPYSFAPYKVIISGFYYEPRFSLAYSSGARPVIPDDTCYFLGFDNFDVAYAVMLCLNSRRVCDYLKSHTFEDAKRPYTKKLLMQLSLKKMVQSLSLDELRASEVRLKLEKRINDSMLGNLLSFMQQRGRQEEPVP
ncbi:MAG TPA: methyltransferase [Candidatus Avisuccinivibrio pullicola]|nr:methyltransferase [Candidatus Avisuccinivibrio pullicola]